MCFVILSVCQCLCVIQCVDCNLGPNICVAPVIDVSRHHTYGGRHVVELNRVTIHLVLLVLSRRRSRRSGDGIVYGTP